MTLRLLGDLEGLDAPERLRALGPPLLEGTPDAELQRLVEEAQRVSGFPLALVSLVTARLQYWRAHAGLPPELAASQGTDRCLSFCQFVVAADAPLEVEDARGEPALPPDLVERYGLRAYVGFPLRVQGQTVGSFCVLDVEARKLPLETLAALQQLSLAASARLEALAATVPAPASPQDAGAHAAWLREAEERPRRSLTERFERGELSKEEFTRALGALSYPGAEDG
jgi:hypothetical protein